MTTVWVGCCASALAQSGFPRAWEAGMPIGTFATANVGSGNVITAIPVVGWGGRGPALGFALFHNSTDAAASSPPQDGSGFSLGAGWRVSYGGRVAPVGGGPPYAGVDVIEDDGTVNGFKREGNAYVAAKGVFDTLEALPTIENPTSWKLTRKDQSFRLFDAQGLLTEVHDAAGNLLSVQRTGGRISAIVDASGRTLNFSYSGPQLTAVSHLLSPQGYTRTWTFAYGHDRLMTITYPAVGGNAYTLAFEYDGGNRISKLTDRDGDSFGYNFDSGRISEVVDPQPRPPYESDPQLSQHFAYVALGDGLVRTDHTDRRGLVWGYTFNKLGEMLQATAPDSTARLMEYDADHNVTSFTNELGRTWSATYDTRGNLLTTTDPLHHGTVRTYDTLNNLLTSEDADGNVWQLGYTDSVDPTALTKAAEPPDGQGNDEAKTFVEYYHDTARRGLPYRIIDANGSATIYDYDQWGQLHERHEGAPDPPETICYPNGVCDGLNSDSAGRLLSSSSGLSGHSYCVDDLDNVSCIQCVWAESAGGGQPGSYLPPLPDCGAFPLSTTEPNPTMQWTAMSQLAAIVRYIDGLGRTATQSHDALGRLRATSKGGEWGADPRAFSFTPNWGTGVSTRTGPDSVITQVATDTKYRPIAVGRLDNVIAQYGYWANDQVRETGFNDGTGAEYFYDDAERLTTVRYTRPSGGTLLELDYTYTTRDLVESVTEIDEAEQASLTWFTYDVRGRLIQETRSGTHPYDLAYSYDQLGNRLTKTDALNGRATTYHYDVQDPNYYNSINNRLMWYEIHDSQTSALIETVWNAYDIEGKITRVIRKLEGDPTYRATRMVYNTSKQVEFVVGETWTSSNCATYQRTYAWRFRYDSPRARYMRQRLNATTLTPQDTSWSDFDGEDIYGDFSVANDEATMTRGYLTGIGELPDPSQSNPAAVYYQQDLIGSTRTITCDPFAGSLACPPEPNGDPPIVRRTIYTAFGEVVHTDGTIGTRYQYAGAWGYQSHEDFPFLHVGHRYYDPETGRFLQRDPIGIFGGLNVYVYVGNNPVLRVDPSGQGFWDGSNWFHDWVARNVWMRVHSRNTLANMSDGRAYAEAIGSSVVIGAGGYYGVSYMITPGAGSIGVGYGSGGFFFRGAEGWMFGYRGIVYAAQKVFPWLTILLPARFPQTIGGPGSAGGYNCFTTLLSQIWNAL